MAAILAAKSESVEASLGSDVPWQQAMKRAIRSGTELCRLLGVPEVLASERAESDFPVFAPLEFVARMQPGDANDPLLRQVLGVTEETESTGKLDPVGDLASVRAEGLLQKYDRRVLLITTGACAVHCRYCFRRHFPYEAAPKGRHGWESWLQVIRNDSTVDEVILSGGDPLSVADDTLAWFVAELGKIAHVRRLRVHTRFPVVIPQRVCRSLLAWVEASKPAVFFVLHFNHAHEIDDHVAKALRQLRSAGATLLNQAVLLNGVNDSAEKQLELCLRLVNQQVLPYYLHQLDPVQGAMHFDVQDAIAREIIDHLRSHLPGYAVPKLVREIAGEASKTPV